MTKSLHVAHVVLSLDVGGLERVVLDLVREGQRLGQRRSILCLERPGALAEAAQSLGAEVVCADKSPGLRVGTIERLKQVLAELRPDVVHSHQIGALLYAGPAAWWAGVPVVVHTEHGKHYATRWRTRLLGRLAARFAQRFFCVSEDLASEVRRHHIVSPGKVRVVPNGIDTERFAQTGDREGLRRLLNIPAGAPVIGTVGRLTEVKRQDILIRAFAALKTRLPEARLLLVGDGERREELEALVRELGLGPSVHFAGYQAEPQAYLQIMDVFALSSRSEGMPLAVLEAWAAGVPVVASRVGGAWRDDHQWKYRPAL